MRNILYFVKKNILYFAWLQALAATFGSLYASEILGWAPCVLCWYQRILMYPLVFILPVGILKKDKNLPFYVLPLSILGGLIALYQYLLQVGIIPKSTTPCTFGISCTVKYVDLFGFITLPLLSFLGFAFITASVLIFQKFSKKS